MKKDSRNKKLSLRLTPPTTVTAHPALRREGQPGYVKSLTLDSIDFSISSNTDQ